MDFNSTVKGSLLEGFYPAGWDMEKIDRLCSCPPESVRDPQPFWNPGFTPVECAGLEEFNVKMGHEIAREIKAAKDAGAVFGVAPGFDPAIVAYAQEIGLPMVPGIATASELSQALTAGVPMVKFFPAEAAGGVKMIKNLLGAFRFTGVKFMPTGGVNPQNVKEYLSVPEIVACGGTWIVPKDALAANDWAAIEKLAAEAAAIAKAR